MHFKMIFMVGLLMVHTNVDAKKVAYINAKIWNGAEISKENAFVVEDGRFVELGSSDVIKKSFTNAVDLNNALVLPGFIEAHGHLLGIGQGKISLDLRHLNIDDIVVKVKEQAKLQRAGTWITGRGWDQNLWASKEFPNQTLLRGINHPIYLRRVDGHAVWVNDLALAKAGINNDTKNPPGGQIIRDEQGHATGVLIDNAIDLVSVHLDKPSRTDLELYVKLGVLEVLSRGITSFHDAGAGKAAIDLFQDLAQKDQLNLRLNVMIDGQDQNLVDYFFARGPLVGDFLTVRSIKYFADGALGSRGAALLTDYHDHPHHQGLLLIDQTSLVDKTKAALKNGFQVATHAIGDGANRLVLDAYQAALLETKDSNSRLRIEHAQLVAPEDHARFKELSVIASMQPIHCTSDMAWVADRLGPERVKDRAYPWRSLLNNGAVLAFGSDAPVEDVNPILGLYASVSRANVDGMPDNGFMPEQKLKLSEALHGYHHGGAYAEFNEDQKGKIAKGFLADFVVFDTDLFQANKSAFLQAKPLMTVVNGKVVYRRKRVDE